MSELTLDYHNLSPEVVLDAVESQGFRVDGRYIVLNSYENRVYQVNLEEGDPIIAKFYRPNRWTNEAIEEEHRFSIELYDAELPVVAPWKNEADVTIFNYQNFRFSLYPRRGGHPPEPSNLDQLYRLGSLMGRLHAFGATKAFEHRKTISVQSHCIEPSAFLIEASFIPNELVKEYKSLTDQIAEQVTQAWAKVPNLKTIRTHGDCHLSNIIWSRDEGPWLLDFDDAAMAPAIQDLWMLISGEPAEKALQMSEILEGYQAFFDFDLAELQLIEPLRSLRMIHYSAWLAHRWDDPAFTKHFPWFNTLHYWQQHLTELDNQIHEMQKPSLQLCG